MAGDTFLDPKTDLWPNKVSLCRWLPESRDIGRASAARNPDYGSLQPKGRPSPTRNRLVETTAGTFSQPEGANRWRRAKVDETFGMAMAEKYLDFVDLQSFENVQPCIDIWACDFFCVQTVLFHTLYVFFVVGPSGTASLSVMRQPA
jgi:hypothetical protein